MFFYGHFRLVSDQRGGGREEWFLYSLVHLCRWPADQAVAKIKYPVQLQAPGTIA